MKVRYGLLLGISLLLAGCGGSADNAVEEGEGVFDPMVDTIDRAQGVQDLNMDRKDEMDQALEDME